MTKQIFHNAQLVEQKIKETKVPIKLLEGCKIVSITVRKFDHVLCEFQDVVITQNIPRQKIKDLYLKTLHSDLESLKYKLQKMLNDEELPIQNRGESLLQEF